MPGLKKKQQRHPQKTKHTNNVQATVRILSISRHTHTYTTYNNIRTRATYTQQTIKSPKHGGLAAKGNNKQQALAATQAIERMSKIKMHCFTQ